MLSIDLENSGPLVYGTTQKEQNLSHPSCIDRNSEDDFEELKIRFLNFSFCKNSLLILLSEESIMSGSL